MFDVKLQKKSSVGGLFCWFCVPLGAAELLATPSGRSRYANFCSVWLLQGYIHPVSAASRRASGVPSWLVQPAYIMWPSTRRKQSTNPGARIPVVDSTTTSNFLWVTTDTPGWRWRRCIVLTGSGCTSHIPVPTLRPWRCTINCSRSLCSLFP